MKYLLFCLFLFSATGASAQCFIFDTVTTTGGDSVDTQLLVHTTDTLQTCDGFWLPTAEEVRSGTGSNPPSSSGDVVTAIEDSTVALTTAIACLCFFVAMNSWESSAK